MKNKLLLCILTGFLICIAVFTGIKEAIHDEPLYAVISSDSQTEELDLWYDRHYGTVYVFLPAYADLEHVYLKTTESGSYQIGPHIIHDDFSCGVFQLNTPYPVAVKDSLPYNGKQLIFVQSGNVSTLFVDVRSGSMDYLHEDKQHDEPGDIRLYAQDGILLYSGYASAVSGRGQSSWWGQIKKPYNFTLNEEANLLNLGSAKSWSLLACAGDGSFIRNKLVFDFADAVGIPYAPDCTWVDLYLNGEYAGLYLLCERIEVHPERVSISEKNSFLVTKDYPDRLGVYWEDYFTTKDNASLGILYSDFTIHTLAELWQSVENAILSEDGIDPDTGKSWDELIDPTSWAKKFLLEECFGNIDAPILSQYYYLDGGQEGSRICSSPPWDYEVAMTRPTNMVHVYRQNIYGSVWHWALYQKPDFYDLLVQQYQQVFQPLLLEFANQRIENYMQQIHTAAAMNAFRWHLGSTEEYVDSVKTYINQRVAFLDSVWIEENDYVTVTLIGQSGSVYTYLQEPGSLLPPLRVYDDPEILSLGWYYEGTDIEADPNQPIYEDTTVVFRWESAPKTIPTEIPSEPLPKSRLIFACIFIIMLTIVAFADMYRNQKRFRF